MADINDIDEGVARKIMSLLAMAKDARGNENEAANAMRAAQRLADAHAISIANLDPENRDKASKKRADARKEGGLYAWQRELYAAIAELNHCKHWCFEEEVKGKVSAYEKKKYGAEEAKYRAERGYSTWGRSWQHRLLGSALNVMLTQQMAEYLEGAVERLARDYVGNDPKQFWKPSTTAFREGVSSRVVEMLKAKREEDLAEQRRKQQEAQDRGDGTSLILLDDVMTREAEANWDYLYGEGDWQRLQEAKAKSKREYEERIKAAAEAQRIQDEWDAAHPVEAAARKKAEAEASAKYWDDLMKRAGKSSSRSRGYSAPRERQETDRERRRNSSEFYAGRSAGSKISLDKQVDSTTKGRLK